MAIATRRRIGLGTVDIGEREEALVLGVLRSGHISPGPAQRAFEQAVAERHGKQYATFVNSGQSALQLALEVVKRQQERRSLRVLCPAITYISTLHAVWNAGCEVVLADVDPVDWMLAGLADRFDVALPVDLFGKAYAGPCYALPVIEDASHSITTGSGGMVLTDDPFADRMVKRLANHGRVSADDLYTLKDDGTYDMSRRFVFNDEGWSFKSSDLNAALGLGQMERLDDILKRRRTVGVTLWSRLHPYGELQLTDPESHTFQMFPMVCRVPGLKPKLVQHLNSYGIETRDMMPILSQPVVQARLKPRAGQFPVAERIDANGFYIGCHQHLTAEDVDYIVDAVDAFFRG